MGCVFTKEDYEKDRRRELSLSSQISISISELPYIEPIKTQEQIRIEKIQNIFKAEYEKNIKYSIYKYK